MKNAAVIALVMVSAFSAKAQDIHFSQFFFAPQWLNPAEIGQFDAQYRGTANQKTQWREVSQPYTTFALAADGRPDFLPENTAVGMAVMNDRAGDSRFNTFSVLAGGSYTYKIKDSNRHLLTGALQLGFTQVSLNQDALRFDNQFNGVAFDPTLPTGESFARNSRIHANVNLGAAYTFNYAPGKKLVAGWAGHNLTRPDRSFFNETGIDLPLRHAYYVTGDWNILPDIDLLPAMRYMRQRTFSEFVIGTAVRYVLINERNLYRSVFAGYFGRLGDSGIGLIGMEIDDWRAGISYDINMSNLTVASRNRGGFEFSLQYLFNRQPRNAGFNHRFCPTYI
ncbi:MAG: PorP/SprF family type IX secretion system membrane protein [Cryomorphaceae bacterium]|nr:PorP/SprF family type IX secretion system membrane protein [Flavobacteriales bacterium]